MIFGKFSKIQYFIRNFKGKEDHSEVRDKFRLNFQNMLIRSYKLKITKKIWGHHLYKKVKWRHTLIDKLPES